MKFCKNKVNEENEVNEVNEQKTKIEQKILF